MLQPFRESQQVGDSLQIGRVVLAFSAGDVFRDQNVGARMQRGQQVEFLKHKANLALSHRGSLGVRQS